MNSFILAASGVATNLFFSALAGYGFAKLKFQGRKVSFLITAVVDDDPGGRHHDSPVPCLKNSSLWWEATTYSDKAEMVFINSYFAIIIPGAVGAFAVFL